MPKKVIVVEDIKATYEHSKDLTTAIMERLLDFIVEHKAFSAECAMQADSVSVNAQELVADLIDAFDFQVEYE